VEDLDDGGQAVRRARGVGDDVVLGRIVGLLVDAQDDGDVRVGGRRGDDDLRGAALLDVLDDVRALGVLAGRLDDGRIPGPSRACRSLSARTRTFRPLMTMASSVALTSSLNVPGPSRTEKMGSPGVGDIVDGHIRSPGRSRTPGACLQPIRRTVDTYADSHGTSIVFLGRSDLKNSQTAPEFRTAGGLLRGSDGFPASPLPGPFRSYMGRSAGSGAPRRPPAVRLWWRRTLNDGLKPASADD
jgi:hypothetical protein